MASNQQAASSPTDWHQTNCSFGILWALTKLYEPKKWSVSPKTLNFLGVLPFPLVPNQNLKYTFMDLWIHLFGARDWKMLLRLFFLSMVQLKRGECANHWGLTKEHEKGISWITGSPTPLDRHTGSRLCSSITLHLQKENLQQQLVCWGFALTSLQKRVFIVLGHRAFWAQQP